MSSLCGADCSKCQMKSRCSGCAETCGKPFGGKCIAAEYIKAFGKEPYEQFKGKLLDEVNVVLSSLDLPKAEQLVELLGAFVNLEYKLPNGEKIQFLENNNVYLGCQIELSENICIGVIADMSFIIVSQYETDGVNPELLLYKKR